MTTIAAHPVELTGVPETMLWTLHNRAHEARRPDTYLRDPDCVRIYDAIAYDYTRSFGNPDDSHPMRSYEFDAALRPWLRAHPGAAVIELAAGLETQERRCDDGKVRWYCVDVPEALEVRRRYLPPGERCTFLGKSALDLTWMDDVDPSGGVFVSAQGLFMYFEENDVRRLISAMFERFPGMVLMFDAIPRWFSQKTLRGFDKTRHYTAPPMPWGANRDEIAPLLESWSENIGKVDVRWYGKRRGPFAAAMRLLGDLPGLRNLPPTLVIAHGLPRSGSARRTA